MMNERRRVRTMLITSVGSLVGHNILESLGPRRREWRVVGINSQPLAVNNFRCDVAYLVPETAQEEAYLSRMREVLRTEQPAVVLAGRDLDLPPLARLKAEPEFAQIFFLLPAAAAVPVVNDKYATWLFARRYGLPFAATAFNRAELDTLIARKGFPLICKRRYGNASRGVFILRSASEADAALAEGNFVFQEFLSPPPNLQALLPDFRFGMPLFYGIVEDDHYSAQGLVGNDGELLGFLAILNTMEGGKDISHELLDEPALERMTADYARALGRLGYIGPLNLNCKKISPNRFMAYELNGRFTGATAARALFGYPEVEYALDYFLDGRRPEPTHESRPYGGASRCIIQRLPGAHLLGLDLVTQLTSAGVWAKPEDSSEGFWHTLYPPRVVSKSR
jgi:carbamoyl-phosphate synthase large subunit